jgi:hypothetical protein
MIKIPYYVNLKITSAVPAGTFPMGDSQGGERILPLENKPKLRLGAVSNHRGVPSGNS